MIVRRGTDAVFATNDAVLDDTIVVQSSTGKSWLIKKRNEENFVIIYTLHNFSIK